MSFRHDHQPVTDGADDVSADTTADAGEVRAKRLAASAERRRANKLARAAAPAPTRDPIYDGRSLTDLRAARRLLMEEETRVSYWRRVMKARLDVAGGGGRGTTHADLSGALSNARGAVSRLAHIDVHPVDDLEPLPDLAELWTRQITPAEPSKLQALIGDLQAAEAQLSVHRADILRRIDLVTAELVARYREQPTLALLLLPDHASHSPHVPPRTGQDL